MISRASNFNEEVLYYVHPIIYGVLINGVVHSHFKVIRNRMESNHADTITTS